MNLVPPQGVNPKKRLIMPHELYGKFSSKADFLKYFKEQLQLYIPPEYMINKDFLKEVFTGEKALFSMNEVKRVNVPMYDELSVVSFWPQM